MVPPGLILENWVQGRHKHLWLSVGADLKIDTNRDLADVGGGQPSRSQCCLFLLCFLAGAWMPQSHLRTGVACCLPPRSGSSMALLCVSLSAQLPNQGALSACPPAPAQPRTCRCTR